MHINIRYNAEYQEYRVPAHDGSEAGAYYTDDVEDAIATAQHLYNGAISSVGINGRKFNNLGVFL